MALYIIRIAFHAVFQCADANHSSIWTEKVRDAVSVQTGESPGRHLWTITDRVCEMWRTCQLSASNMWPVISLTVPVIATAAHQAASSVFLWAFGSSDCWSEGFIIFPLIAECSLWVKFNTAIQLPRNVLTNLHLKHFPMESKQRHFV